jgi:YD repeat-containing protein
MVSYQSLGATRGLVLRYDSLTADPRPIVHFRFSEVYNPYQLLVAKLSFQRGSFNYRVPGYQGTQFGLTGGENFWGVPTLGNFIPSGIVDGVLQADLRSQPSGRYTYTLERGVIYFDPNLPAFVPLSFPETGKIIHVNNIGSIFGNGWTLESWQEIVENPDGSLLLLDGNGSQLLFEPPTAGNTYISPAGDYSTLVRLADGTYRRTLKDRTVYQFNAAKKLSSVRDRFGNRTNYTYDATGKLNQIIDPLNQTITLAYDKTGNLTQITDPLGNNTTYSYDTLDRLISETNALAKARTYQYDPVGNPIRVKDRNNRVRTFSYDALNRIVREQWLNAAGLVIRSFNYTYDAAGQLIRAIDPDSTYNYTYDAAGQELTINNNGTPSTPNVLLSATYNRAGSRIGLSDTINGQFVGTATFAYDTIQRLSDILPH